MTEKKVGDIVWLDGYTSFAQQNSQEELPIEAVEHRFDEMTGERYPIYKVGGNWFDGRNGSCYLNKNSMYYIEL